MTTPQARRTRGFIWFLAALTLTATAVAGLLVKGAAWLAGWDISVSAGAFIALGVLALAVAVQRLGRLLR